MQTDHNSCEHRQNVTRTQALELISQHLTPLPSVDISVLECSERTAAQAICSTISLPEHDRSAMDGFAVLSAATATASPANPVTMEFCGEIRPSVSSPGKAVPNCAVRVLTGGIIPHGTDAVVPFEKVKIFENSIEISTPLTKGDFIRPCGSDIMQGETIVAKNRNISPCQAALLGYAGIRTVAVRCTPSIAVLAVGNELCDPAFENHCGLIPADNLILLKSLCRKDGIDNIKISPCANSPEEISAAIKSHSECDLIITTGGTGPGNRDFVYNSVIATGGTTIFKGLAMHPAKSIFACILGNSMVIGLPGPPNAVNLAFHTVIKPILNILFGIAEISPQTTARLKDSVKGSLDREKLRPCHLSEINGQLIADPLTSEKLSPRKIMNVSNGIIVLPPACGELEAGEIVQVIKNT